MSNNTMIHNPRWQEEWINNYWLGLGDTFNLKVDNPLAISDDYDKSNPHIFMLDLMRRPENFSITCQYLLNIELPLFQIAILKELWTRPFPMLLGSRGMGKCIAGDSIIVTQDGFRKIQDVVRTEQVKERYYFPDLKLLGENGFHKAEYGWNNGRSQIKKVSTESGYQLDMTLNHPIRVHRDGENKWVESKDIKVGDYVCLNRNIKWFENTNSLSEEEAYTLGLITANTKETKDNLIFFFKRTEDFQLVFNHIKKLVGEENINIDLQDRQFYVDKNLLNLELEGIPQEVMSARKESVLSYLAAILNSSAYISSDLCLYIPSFNGQFLRELQVILLYLGIPTNKMENRPSIFGYKLNCLSIFRPYFSKLISLLGDSINKDVLNSLMDYRSDNLFIIEPKMNTDNYFYDEVKSIEDSFACTYDVHMESEEDHSFISNGFTSHNSFILALYAVLRATFTQGSKVVIVGSGFRQAKTVFDYCSDIWDKAPVLRDLAGNKRTNGPRREVDKCSLRIGESTIVALPLGDGQKIRGQRSTVTIADEFASIDVSVFETVVRGFGAVSMQPVTKMKQEYRMRALEALGLSDNHSGSSMGLSSNQTVISGTAYYSFNHFYEYWKRYSAIINSRGDEKILRDVFNGEIPNKFNWKDYSVIRIPFNLLPPTFMDEKQIAQAKATVHHGTYLMEYGAIFSDDSNGFFSRKLIESCVVGKNKTPIEFNGEEIRFTSQLIGNPNNRYVIGVDPASENDNLAIVILEVAEGYRKIVHCWTTNRGRFKAKKKRGLTIDEDYYGYAARKIRELIKRFPCERLAIDSQGGGVALIESLQDGKKLELGERLILPVVDFDKPKDSDGVVGDHIIEIINFAKAEWVSEANHGMKKDFGDKLLLFPEFDSAALGLAIEDDKMSGRVKVSDEDRELEKLYDTLEDCMMEIEELKDELACITHGQTEHTKRERWDVPQVKSAGDKKGRLRKDRYSALLMANMVARTISRPNLNQQEYEALGGFAKDLSGKKTKGGGMWQCSGGDGGWYTQEANASLKPENHGAIVRRK